MLRIYAACLVLFISLGEALRMTGLKDITKEESVPNASQQQQQRKEAQDKMIMEAVKEVAKSLNWGEPTRRPHANHSHVAHRVEATVSHSPTADAESRHFYRADGRGIARQLAEQQRAEQRKARIARNLLGQNHSRATRSKEATASQEHEARTSRQKNAPETTQDEKAQEGFRTPRMDVPSEKSWREKLEHIRKEMARVSQNHSNHSWNRSSWNRSSWAEKHNRSFVRDVQESSHAEHAVSGTSHTVKRLTQDEIEINKANRIAQRARDALERQKAKTEHAAEVKRKQLEIAKEKQERKRLQAMEAKKKLTEKKKAEADAAAAKRAAKVQKMQEFEAEKAARKKKAQEEEKGWKEWRTRWAGTNTSDATKKQEQRQERVIIDSGLPKDDPFEKALHFDDWVSGTEEHYLDLHAPVCLTHLGAGDAGCDLISQKLCYPNSKRLPGLGGSVAKCFREKSTCAVVGSSHHLLNATFGKLIDQHDVVIRINAAPDGTELGKSGFDYSSHVGARTDVRFVNEFGHVPKGYLDQQPMCLFLHEPRIEPECGKYCWRNPGLCNITCNHITNLYCAKEPEKCNKNAMSCRGKGMKEPLDWGHHSVILDSLFAGITDQVVPHPTAGFKAVMYALSTCKKVSLFGFGPSCKGEEGVRYYPEAIGAYGWHHYGEELMLLKKAMKFGTKAVIPPQARDWMKASSVKVITPKCLEQGHRAQLSSIFEHIGMSQRLDLHEMKDQDSSAAESGNGVSVDLDYEPKANAGFVNF